MSDIRRNSDDQIRETLSPMISAASDVAVTRANRHDRTSPVQAITIAECARLTFEQLSQLAGVCMTPDITITACGYLYVPGLEVAIRWGVPLTVAVDEMVTVEAE